MGELRVIKPTYDLSYGCTPSQPESTGAAFNMASMMTCIMVNAPAAAILELTPEV